MKGSQSRQKSPKPDADRTLGFHTSVKRKGVLRNTFTGSDEIAAKSAPCMSVLMYETWTCVEINQCCLHPTILH